MKIMFIKPKTELHMKYIPINFLSLAGHLRNHEIKIIDGHLNDLMEVDILNEVGSFEPDIVCFGGLSSEIEYSLSMAKQIKRELQKL